MFDTLNLPTPETTSKAVQTRNTTFFVMASMILDKPKDVIALLRKYGSPISEKASPLQIKDEVLKQMASGNKEFASAFTAAMAQHQKKSSFAVLEAITGLAGGVFDFLNSGTKQQTAQTEANAQVTNAMIALQIEKEKQKSKQTNIIIAVIAAMALITGVVIFTANRPSPAIAATK